MIKRSLFDMQLASSTYFEVANAERSEIIGRLGGALARLAAGDVGTLLAGLPPEHQQIERDYEAMRKLMRDALHKVADAVEAIRTGSVEIAQASDDLAQRT